MDFKKLVPVQIAAIKNVRGNTPEPPDLCPPHGQHDPSFFNSLCGINAKCRNLIAEGAHDEFAGPVLDMHMLGHCVSFGSACEILRDTESIADFLMQICPRKSQF